MKIVLLLDVDDGTRHTDTLTLSQNFLHGTTVSGGNPIHALIRVAKAWEERDRHQAMLNEIDDASDP